MAGWWLPEAVGAAGGEPEDAPAHGAAALAALERELGSPLYRQARACWRRGGERVRRRLGAAQAAFGVGLARIRPLDPDGAGGGWEEVEDREAGALAALTLPLVAWQGWPAADGGTLWLARVVDLLALDVARPERCWRLAEAVDWLGPAGEGGADPAVWPDGIARVYADPLAWLDGWRASEGRDWLRRTAEACAGAVAAELQRGLVRLATPAGLFLPSARPVGRHGLCPLAPPAALDWTAALAGAARVRCADRRVAEWLEARLAAERKAALPPPPPPVEAPAEAVAGAA